MKILIDGRLYGPEHTGNGRYTMNLIQELAKFDKKNTYVVLLREKYFRTLKFPPNWKKVKADFKHYSIDEQIKLPFIVKKYKPDLAHFPHFNVPVFYFGKFVVTIHDMTMHTIKGKDATTRRPFFYRLWGLAYHLAFAKAIYASQKVIVPSQAVKSEILNYYKVKQDKIKVVYE